MTRPVRVGSIAVVLALAATALLGAGTGAAAQTHSASLRSVPEQMPSNPNTNVGSPALSYNGRYIAYVADRRGHPAVPQQLRRADLNKGRDELLNRSINGGVADGNNSMPATISGDGSRVAFTSSAADLVTDDTNGSFDAFVRDASSNTSLLTSAAFGGGVANDDSTMTSLSKNGRYAAFKSSGTDIVPGSTTTNPDIFLRDLTNQTTVQVTLRPDGSPSTGPGATSADVSANGNLVAFTSYDADLTANETPDTDADVFVRNMSTGVTRWLSDGVPAGANPYGVVLSPNGRWISTRWEDGSLHLTKLSTGVTSTVADGDYALFGAFSSQGGKFVYMSGGTPYVRNLTSGVNTPIATPDGGFVTTVSVSGNGQFAAYDWAPDDGGPSLIFRIAL